MNAMDDLKVLYVEDDLFAQEEMSCFLKKRVDKIFVASDGIEGIEQFEIHKPDIVIVDLLMPRMDGIEMIKQLKAIRPNVHIIVLTSVSTLETVLYTMDIGVDNYIIKPFEFAELELKLNKIGDAIHFERGKKDGLLDGLEDKGAVEDAIKKAYIKALKGYMGKGPREITVQIINDKVKITVFNTLTTMEESLMQDAKNYEIVRQTRSVAYEALSRKFEEIISKEVGVDMAYDKAIINLKRRIEQVVFTANQSALRHMPLPGNW